MTDNTKPNLYVFSLEPLENRYTAVWYNAIPDQLTTLAGDAANVVQVPGVQKEVSVTPGAFLNFSDTNRWKSTQLVAFLDMFDAGKTTPNDVFLFTDAWNPVIMQIKYINDLMGFNWKIGGLWHAGNYDPSDILGMKMAKPWPSYLEKSIYYACDHNWFATKFHRDMFCKNLKIPKVDQYKAVVSGQPYEDVMNILREMDPQPKSGVIWPHRYNSDKQPEIAEDLSADQDTPWCITQKLNLSKSDYYKKLTESQVIFSCSLHENLGVSMMEGVMAGAIPIMPNRCSYSEIYMPEFLYPSEWTESLESYRLHKLELQKFINHRLEHPDLYAAALSKQKLLMNNYFSAKIMFDSLLEDIANFKQDVV